MMENNKKTALAVIVILSFILMLTGCESLRRKFTRKRKDREPQEQMIIVPRDYSAHPFPSDVMYKQYFIYWKSWNQELITSLNDYSTHKKIVDCVEQAILNLNKMAAYLNEDKSKELTAYIKKTEVLKTQIIAAKSMPPSRMAMLRYDAERILSSVNRLFDLKKMKEYLKQAPFIFADPPSDQKKAISNNFTDIKEGVTTEKDILLWFGKPAEIIDDSTDNPGIKVLIYSPNDLSLSSPSYSLSPPVPKESLYVTQSAKEFDDASRNATYLININKSTGSVESKEKKIFDWNVKDRGYVRVGGTPGEE